MRGFKIEAAGLEGGEETLNAPALAIHLQGPATWLETADDDILVGKPQRSDVEVVPIDPPRFSQDALMLFQPAKPLLANKFAITDQGLNPGGWKHGQDPFYQGDALGGIRVAFFVQQRPEKRKGHALSRPDPPAEY